MVYLFVFSLFGRRRENESKNLTYPLPLIICCIISLWYDTQTYFACDCPIFAFLTGLNGSISSYTYGVGFIIVCLWVCKVHNYLWLRCIKHTIVAKHLVDLIIFSCCCFSWFNKWKSLFEGYYCRAPVPVICCWMYKHSLYSFFFCFGSSCFHIYSSISFYLTFSFGKCFGKNG